MPTLTIDNRTVEVPQGTKVIEAAEKLGIMIPRFCFHPALGAVGACRVCAVAVIKGSRTGVQMSCQLAVEEGMVISTTDPAALAMRRHVIEWLMLNHPHDCPVCDEGGHCLLQDLTVSGGHGRRRYEGKKRTHGDQNLGPLVAHEMNRCIQCYRCVRFYREYSGYSDLGVTGIGSRVYFGRFEDGALESPFAGNLIDICPTGVFTDKPSRYAGRRWDFDRSPSICIHCSLGCATTVSVRYREVVRQEARYAKEVNGHFICDRGRYGFAYANLPERPRKARVNGEPVSVAVALKAAGERLNSLAEATGNGIACIGSVRSSLDTLAAIESLSKQTEWRKPVTAMPTATLGRVLDAVSGLNEDCAVSLSEVAVADAVVVAGCDPINEAPMLALVLRQANRNGAEIIVIDPRPVRLPFDFLHFPVARDDVPRVLINLTVLETNIDSGNADIQRAMAAIRKSKKPVVVCGTDAAADALPHAATDSVLTLRAAGIDAGLFYTLPGANAFGAIRVFGQPASMEQIADAVDGGDIRALLIVEADLEDGCSAERWKACREKLDLLVVVDYKNTAVSGDADIFLPSQTLFESGGTFINQEGRIQKALPAFSGGTSIRRTGDGGHPPRRFGKDIPGGEPVAAWRLLARLSGIVAGGEGDVEETLWLQEALEGSNLTLSDRDLSAVGFRALSPAGSGIPNDRETLRQSSPAASSDEAWDLLLVDETFGTETLSAAAVCLKEKILPPRALIHRSDAEDMGLRDGDSVTISVGDASVCLPVTTSEKMARKTVVVSRHPDSNWRTLLGVGVVSVTATANPPTGGES